MNGKFMLDIGAWTILAALAVLVVMNASNVAQVVTSVGGFWTTETSMFTGSNYNTTHYGK